MKPTLERQAIAGAVIGAFLFIAFLLLRSTEEGEAQRILDLPTALPPGATTNAAKVIQNVANAASPNAPHTSPSNDVRDIDKSAVVTPRVIAAEPTFAPNPTSGGLLVRLAIPTLEFDVIAVMVPYLAEYRPVGFGSGGPPVRTMRTRSAEGVAFIPYLGQDRALCWINSQARGDVFENLQIAIPPAPPNEVTLELNPEMRKGVVIGTARFGDGRPAGGYEIRVNPEGSSMWSTPLDVHGPADFRAAMGRIAITDSEGNFEVVGLPVGEGAQVSLSLRGQALTGATGVSISDGRESARPVSLIVPYGSTRMVTVRCRDLPVAGLVLYLSAEGVPSSSIRCDRRGEASVFVPDVAETVTIGCAVMTFTTRREVRHALAAEGIPESLQNRLFSFLATVAGQTRIVFNRTHEADKILTLDLTAALALFGHPNSELSPLHGFRRSIEASSSVASSIRDAIEAGNVEGVFLRFLEVLGTTAATLGG